MDLEDQQERLLNISLNKVSGNWDEGALAALLDELQVGGADIVLSGFEQEEFEELIAEFGTIPDTEIEDPVIDDNFDVQGALDNIHVSETQRGDIGQFGPHRLMCGDSTRKEDVGCLMDGEMADLVVTDPPYNVPIESDSARLAADGRSSIQNDDMPAEEFSGFLHAVFERYSSKGKAPGFYGDRHQTTVWRAGLPVEEPEQSTVWKVSREDVGKYVHPTQKPLELLAIRPSSCLPFQCVHK
ncbi:hypothetical protein [Paenibacillus pabuli]|uniref:hypothetical protein n=1 Tax=Paenibacillus pabuli TaxID=1472 RepID=UPI001FFF01E0|nr:hypothetical protein [Paenibacillus pabuli]UPK45171.1 site-specific DNA-methyltransferase [Paenibacillus pabuli]